ncbi:hypothetical protein ACYOEI_42340, partial [Singulisphaera rosea]
MQYKTIMLELIQDRPKLHRQLQASRTLLSTLDRYASSLKSRHAHWTGQLIRAGLAKDPLVIASEALELAIEEMKSALPSGATPSGSDSEPPSLDAAMSYLR